MQIKKIFVVLVVLIIIFYSDFISQNVVTKGEAIKIANAEFEKRNLGDINEYEVKINNRYKTWHVEYYPKKEIYKTNCTDCPEWIISIHEFTHEVILAETALIKHRLNGMDSDKTIELNRSRQKYSKKKIGGCSRDDFKY